jgi:hypothetical protein
MGAPLVVERSGGIIPKLRERNLAHNSRLKVERLKADLQPSAYSSAYSRDFIDQ